MPEKAISLVQNRAFIDRTKCIECGKCKQVCPYGAIIEIHRPCVRACALGAISIGEDRKAAIDHENVLIVVPAATPVPLVLLMSVVTLSALSPALKAVKRLLLW